MKGTTAALVALGLCASTAYAEDKPGMKPESAPNAAADKASGSNVAKDPNEVKSQQGDTSKSSPGTVGAAPGADTNSQGK